MSLLTAKHDTRLESVLRAGIVQCSTGTNASDAKRANASNTAATSFNLMELDDDLLLKILDGVVGDDEPCRQLQEFCRVNKAACDDGRLYDAINKRFGWYGPYNTLENLNQNRRSLSLTTINMVFMKNKRPLLDLVSPWSAKEWFQYSCYVFIELSNRSLFFNLSFFERYSWDKIKFETYRHPALIKLKERYATKYFKDQIQIWTTMLTKRNLLFLNLDLDQRIRNSDEEFEFQTWIRIIIDNLKELIRVIEKHEELETMFKNLVRTVWHPVITKLYYDDYNEELRELKENVEDLFNVILFHTSLFNKFGIVFDQNADDVAAAHYGFWQQINKNED